MMRAMRSLLLACLVACSSSKPAPSQTATPVEQPTPVDPNCGMKTTDWCPAPAGDPCGAHKTKASCMADARCGGIHYRGESFVACQFDDRGFASNCPTVGCKSL